MRSGTRRNDQVRNAKITRNYIGGYKNGRRKRFVAGFVERSRCIKR